MRMNAAIPMMGNALDIPGAFQRGRDMRQQNIDAERQNALASTMQQYGAGAARGDQNALDQIAAFDPAAAQGLGMNLREEARDETRLKHGMGVDNARLEIARSEAAMRAKEYAMRADRAEVERDMRKGMLMAAGGRQALAAGPEAWDRWNDKYPEFSNVAFDDAPIALAEIDGTVMGAEEALQVGAQEILTDGTIIQSTDKGPRVYGPTGEVMQGQAAADAVRAARQMGVDNQRDIYGAREGGKLETQAELGSAAESAKRSGTIAADKGAEAFEGYATVVKSISTIDEAIAAIDQGAQAGAVQRYLPSVTLASATLENTMNRMGLDVIGSVTFGALSEGEMKLAMETAVPRNLDAPQLREWLSNKRAAQEKAAEALGIAATYLSTPGNTVASWMDQQGAPGRKPTGRTSGGIEWSID